MHDTLNYFKEDPINRRYHHDKITFGTVYSFHENFMLPLSHDEVVHGKQSLIYKMPGDEWQKFANLRALYLYMYTFVGTKLLFMGGEFGQTSEWNVNQSLDWHLTQFEPHRGMQQFVKDLNMLYRAQPALYERAFSPDGFKWLEYGDQENSVFVYLRRGNAAPDDVLVVLNLTPVVRDYRVGVPTAGLWEVVLNSDDVSYYGSGTHQHAALSEEIAWMDCGNSIALKLPPLGGLVLKQV